MRRRRAPRPLVVLAVFVSLVSTGMSAASPKEAAAGPKNPKAPIPLPDVSETADTVLNEDGSFTASLYTGRVHYRDDKNDFKDIGNDFVPSDKPGYAWSNGANQFNAEFKALLGKDFLRLDVGGNAFSATLEGSLPVPAVALGVEITYAGAVPHVDLAYHALPDEVREYLTLLDPLAQSTFRFILSPPDGAKVLPEQRKDG